MARKPANGWSNVGRSDSERSPDLANANAERLLDTLHRLLTVGDALFISRTRDGGAIRVQVYSGDDKQSWYVADALEFDELMLAMRTHLDNTAS